MGPMYWCDVSNRTMVDITKSAQCERPAGSNLERVLMRLCKEKDKKNLKKKTNCKKAFN